ncbi:MAG: POTRA domain-containing protein, partial [Candidatus Korobacteraceae bacterium]
MSSRAAALLSLFVFLGFPAGVASAWTPPAGGASLQSHSGSAPAPDSDRGLDGSVAESGKAGDKGASLPSSSATPSPNSQQSFSQGQRASASTPAWYQDRTIATVMFEGISVSEDADQDLRALALQPGERLNRVKLGESLRALYATGHFANLQVEAERQGETGVALVYRATPNYFVGRVSATGAPGPPTNAQLADAARLHLGEVYTRGSADRGLELMKDVLRENGYYQPVITVEERRDPSTHQVELRFDVQPGLPATIGDVIVEGSPGYTIEEIREITRLRQGEVVTAQRTSQAIERLRERYSRDRRLEAQVRLTERKFHAEGNTLDYLFMIERGPTVEIEVSGADVNQRRLRQLVPVYAEHAVDEDLLNEGRRNLLDYFQTQGYFDAEVQFRRESSDDHLQVVYMAERGERHILAGIV